MPCIRHQEHSLQHLCLFFDSHIQLVVGVDVQLQWMAVEDTLVAVDDTLVAVEDTLLVAENTLVVAEDTLVVAEDSLIAVGDTPVEDSLIAEDTLVAVGDTLVEDNQVLSNLGVYRHILALHHAEVEDSTDSVEVVEQSSGCVYSQLFISYLSIL